MGRLSYRPPTLAAVLRNQDRRPLAVIEEDRRRAISAADAAVAEFDAETFVATQLDLTNHGQRNRQMANFSAVTSLGQMGMVSGRSRRRLHVYKTFRTDAEQPKSAQRRQ